MRPGKQGPNLTGGMSIFDIARWKDAAEAIQVDLSNYTAAIPDRSSFLAENIQQCCAKFLLDERNRAMQQVVTADCRTGSCAQCGVCGKELKPVFRNDWKSSGATVAAPVLKAEATAASQQGPYHYRIHYEKGDSLRFLGHLDMVSIVHRAFSDGESAHLCIRRDLIRIRVSRTTASSGRCREL